MASPRETYGVSEAMDSIFPAAEINEELNPGENKDFQVDSFSFQIANSLEIEEKEEAEEKEKRRKKKKKNKDSTKALKKTIIVSAVVLAVAVAAIGITKKLKEK